MGKSSILLETNGRKQIVSSLSGDLDFSPLLGYLDQSLLTLSVAYLLLPAAVT